VFKKFIYFIILVIPANCIFYRSITKEAFIWLSSPTLFYLLSVFFLLYGCFYHDPKIFFSKLFMVPGDEETGPNYADLL
jgi:isoprenylcysteine carboxyl methyltransferase (ICMT) family protein YpbQ